MVRAEEQLNLVVSHTEYVQVHETQDVFRHLNCGGNPSKSYNKFQNEDILLGFTSDFTSKKTTFFIGR